MARDFDPGSIDYFTGGDKFSRVAGDEEESTGKVMVLPGAPKTFLACQGTLASACPCEKTDFAAPSSFSHFCTKTLKYL